MQSIATQTTDASRGTPSDSPVPQEARGGCCDRSRLLIADDESAIVELFQMVLGEAFPDHSIDVAGTGVEAVESFTRHRQAVLLMDLHMPEMDGLTAFNRIMDLCGQRRWEVPAFVFCTGFAPPSALKAFVKGSDKHSLLSKPVSHEVLIETIRRGLMSG